MPLSHTESQLTGSSTRESSVELIDDSTVVVRIPVRLQSAIKFPCHRRNCRRLIAIRTYEHLAGNASEKCVHFGFIPQSWYFANNETLKGDVGEASRSGDADDHDTKPISAGVSPSGDGGTYSAAFGIENEAGLDGLDVICGCEEVCGVIFFGRDECVRIWLERMFSLTGCNVRLLRLKILRGETKKIGELDRDQGGTNRAQWR